MRSAIKSSNQILNRSNRHGLTVHDFNELNPMQVAAPIEKPTTHDLDPNAELRVI